MGAGEAGANFRYAVYGSARPITQANLGNATLCMKGVFNNSAKRFGHAFRPPQRLDPKTPTCTIVAGGEPLPNWSGLAVVTTRTNGSRYYAVVATDLDGNAFEETGKGLTARVFQHEIDHLDGILLIDRMSQVERLAHRRTLAEIKQRSAPAAT